MEHLWSRADANPRKSRQTAQRLKPRDYLQPAASRCIRLPGTRDGEEGVNGSSPLEGSAKAPHVGAFAFRSTCRFSRVRWVWSRLWSFRVGEGLGRAGPMPSEPPRQRRGRGMDV